MALLERGRAYMLFVAIPTRRVCFPSLVDPGPHEGRFPSREWLGDFCQGLDGGFRAARDGQRVSMVFAAAISYVGCAERLCDTLPHARLTRYGNTVVNLFSATLADARCC